MNLNFFRSLFKPPVFENDGKKTQAARLLNMVLWFMLAASPVYGAVSISQSPASAIRYLIQSGSGVIVCGAMLYWMRQGHIRSASFILVTSLWIVSTLSAWTGGGTQGNAYLAYIMVIVLATALLGGRVGIITFGLCTFVGLVFNYADSQGLLPKTSVESTSFAKWFEISIYFLVVVLLQSAAQRMVQEALTYAQREITERKQSDLKLQQRAEEMYLLYQMGIALTSKQDLYHALRAMVKELKRLMITDAFHVGLYDPQTDLLTFSLFLNLEEDLQIPPRKLSENPGLSGEVITTRQTLYLPDITDPETQRAHNIVIIIDVGMRSYVGIPLLLEDRVIGIMSVQARLPHAYNQDQIRLLETLAAQVVVTIERSRLLERVRQELVERQQAEESLRASQERYRLISEVISDYTFSTQVDSQGQLHLNWVAGAFQAITGYTFEEYVANGGWLAALHPDDTAQDAKDMETLRSRLPVITEVRTFTKSGQLRWVRVYAHPVWDAERSQLAGIYGAVQDITRRKHAEEEILNSLQEKELLLKEVHHRVKNNMQVIVSMLNLQSAQVNDEKILALLRESQNRVRSMALVHEKLYQSASLAQIDFRDYAHHLVSTLFHSYSPHTSAIDLKVEIGDIVLDIDAAIPCGLIINELVSNALKHAFPDHRAGEVIVRLHSLTAETLELVVENNGVTFPEILDFRHTETLGMQLMLSLVKQLNGEIEMQRLNPGTRFLIRFAHPAGK